MEWKNKYSRPNIVLGSLGKQGTAHHFQLTKMRTILVGCAILAFVGLLGGLLLLQLVPPNDQPPDSVFSSRKDGDRHLDLDSQLAQLVREVRELKAANKRLQEMVESSGIGGRKCRLFSREHETERRELERHIWELYLRINDTQMANPVDKQRIDEQLVHLLAQSNTFSRVDGAIQWHKGELDKIGGRIQSVIHRLQNPKECASARLLRCEFNEVCGFGCHLHHLVYCLAVAAADNRTMVIDNQGQSWRYSSGGWTSVFEPVSCCTVTSRADARRFVQLGQSDRIVYLVHGSAMLEQLPLAFPRQIAKQLLTHHSFPPAFFIGQLVAYLMREKEHTRQLVDNAIKRVPFELGPVVGLQIRRTDKRSEAAFHSLDEYMRWAELWFRVEQRRRLNVGEDRILQKRVFIASDERAVVEEARSRYAHRGFQIFANEGAAEAAGVGTRYSEASLAGLLADIRTLSRCAHLVCTFSSQVCKLAYELMQVHQGDAGTQFHSLDDIFFIGGQNPREWVALGDFRASATTEMDLERGDAIAVAGNHWNGLSKGTNRRTLQTGLFPSFLAAEQWRIANFSIFD